MEYLRVDRHVARAGDVHVRGATLITKADGNLAGDPSTPVEGDGL